MNWNPATTIPPSVLWAKVHIVTHMITFRDVTHSSSTSTCRQTTRHAFNVYRTPTFHAMRSVGLKLSPPSILTQRRPQVLRVAFLFSGLLQPMSDNSCTTKPAKPDLWRSPRSFKGEGGSQGVEAPNPALTIGLSRLFSGTQAEIMLTYA